MSATTPSHGLCRCCRYHGEDRARTSTPGNSPIPPKADAAGLHRQSDVPKRALTPYTILPMATPAEAVIGNCARGHGCQRSQLCPILHLSHAFLASTMGAAVHDVVCLDAVADDAAAAVRTRRGERLDGAFKAVERVRFPSHGDFKGFIVIIAAGFTPCHSSSPFR